MKLLLSAYACEPNKGSEPGVGWNWAMALCRRGYGVHVITRENNRESIEKALKAGPSPVVFSYFDLPVWARFWKYWPGGIYLYYLIWQIGAYQLAKKLHATEKFDCVQHVTFVSCRQPSFMGGLGIPFLFGPIGGGETMPSQLQKGIPMSGKVAEAVRNIGSDWIRYDPTMLRAFSRARTIACTTDETVNKIPVRFRDRCIVRPAIGINEREIRPSAGVPSGRHFLYVGRLLYWKGLHLALRAVKELRRTIPDVTLKVIGSGEDEEWLKQVAVDAGVVDLVQWVPAKAQGEIWQEYRESLAFVFPSLHDSGGMVVLESLSAGLPVICLDLGGPGAIVDSNCGIVVPGKANDEAKVVGMLADAMATIAQDEELRGRLSAGAIARARQMTWDLNAEVVYSRFLGTYGVHERRLSENRVSE